MEKLRRHTGSGNRSSGKHVELLSNATAMSKSSVAKLSAGNTALSFTKSFATEFEAIVIHHKQTSAREREQLEIRHAQTSDLLNVKLAELRLIQGIDDAVKRRATQYSISSLESTLRELDTKHRLSKIEDEELELDMASLKQQNNVAESKHSSPRHQPFHNLAPTSSSATANNARISETARNRQPTTSNHNQHPQLRRQERTLDDDFYTTSDQQNSSRLSSSFTSTDNRHGTTSDLLHRTKQSAQNFLHGQQTHPPLKAINNSTFHVPQPATKLLSFLSSKLNNTTNLISANNNSNFHRSLFSNNNTSSSANRSRSHDPRNPFQERDRLPTANGYNYSSVNVNHIGYQPSQANSSILSRPSSASLNFNNKIDTIYPSSDYAASSFALPSRNIAERDVDHETHHHAAKRNYEISSSTHNPSFTDYNSAQRSCLIDASTSFRAEHLNSNNRSENSSLLSSSLQRRQQNPYASSSPPPPAPLATRSSAAAATTSVTLKQPSSSPHFSLSALPAASAITSDSIASSSSLLGTAQRLKLPSVAASGNSAETETYGSSYVNSLIHDELRNSRPDGLIIYNQPSQNTGQHFDEIYRNQLENHDVSNNAAFYKTSTQVLYADPTHMFPSLPQQHQQQQQQHHSTAALATSFPPQASLDQYQQQQQQLQRERERPHSALLDSGADRQYAQQLIESINVLTSKYSNNSGSESSLTLSQQELNRPLKNVAAVLASAASTLAQREYQQQTYNNSNMNFLGKPAAPANVPLQQQQQQHQQPRALHSSSEQGSMTQLEREVRDLEVNMREQTLRGSPSFGESSRLHGGGAGNSRPTNNYLLPNNNEQQQFAASSSSSFNTRPTINSVVPNNSTGAYGGGGQSSTYNSGYDASYRQQQQQPNSSNQPLLPKTDALLRGGNYPDDSNIMQRHPGGGDQYTQHQPIQHQNTASSTLSSGLGTMSSMGSNGVASQYNYNSSQPSGAASISSGVSLLAGGAGPGGPRGMQQGGNNNADFNPLSSQQQYGSSASFGYGANNNNNNSNNPRMGGNSSFLQRYDNPGPAVLSTMRPNNPGTNRFGQPMQQQTVNNPSSSISSSLFGGAFGSSNSGATAGSAAGGLFSKLKNLADTTTQQILTGLELPTTTAAMQQPPSFYPQTRPGMQQQPRPGMQQQPFNSGSRFPGDQQMRGVADMNSSYGGLSSSMLTTTTTTTTAGLLPLMSSTGGGDMRSATMYSRPNLPPQQQQQYPPTSYQMSNSVANSQYQPQRQQQYPNSSTSYNDALLLQQQQQQLRPSFAGNLIQPLQSSADQQQRDQQQQLLYMQQQQQNQLQQQQRLPMQSAAYNDVLRQFQQQHQVLQQQSALIEPIPVYKLHGAGTSAQAGFFESKIDYDPTKHSLQNNSAQFELPLTKADLILIRGTQKDRLKFPEEEGYVVGENVHGNSGLVPIYALERLSDQITLQTLQQRFPQTANKWFVAQPPTSAAANIMNSQHNQLIPQSVGLMPANIGSGVNVSMSSYPQPQQPQQQVWLTTPAGVAGTATSMVGGAVMAYPVVSVVSSYPPSSMTGIPVGASSANTVFQPQQQQQFAMQQQQLPTSAFTYNTLQQPQQLSVPQPQQILMAAPVSAGGAALHQAQQIYMQQPNQSLPTVQQHPQYLIAAASAPPAPGTTVMFTQQPNVTSMSSINTGMFQIATGVPQPQLQQQQQQPQQQYFLASSQPNVYTANQSSMIAQQPVAPALLPGQQFSHIPIQFSEVLGQLPLSEKHMHEAGLHQDPSVPPPENLTVDKTLIKSVLIAWEHADIPSGLLDSYNVYVDGKFRHNLKSIERTRALVENISSGEPHRVSVRSVTVMGSESDDSQCTIMVGKNASHAPYNLRVSNISASSAALTWLPANSAYEHAIFVNNREYAIVPRRVYKFTVGELKPSQVYRIKIVSRSPSVGKINPQYLTATVDFRTLPDNVPDPPTAVQVESGPQDGSILITWRPLPPQQSQKCGVIGYAIYADGHKVTQIDSPSGDHVLLDSVDAFPAQAFPKFITVRSLSNKHHSRDSSPAHINRQLLPLVRKTQKAMFFRNSGIPESQIPTYMSLNPGQGGQPQLMNTVQQQQYLPPGASSVYGPTSSTFVPPVCQYYDELLPGDTVGSSYRDAQQFPQQRFTTTFPPTRTTTTMSRTLRTTGVGIGDPYGATYQLESPSLYTTEGTPGVFDPLYARNTALPVSTLRRSGIISRMDSLGGMRANVGTTSGSMLPPINSLSDRSLLTDPFTIPAISTTNPLFSNAAAAYMIPKVGTGLGFDERDELSDIIEEEEEALAAEIRSANTSAAAAISALYSQQNTQPYDQMLSNMTMNPYVTGAPMMSYGQQAMMSQAGFQSPFPLTPAPGVMATAQYAAAMQPHAMYGQEAQQQQFYNQNQQLQQQQQNMYGQMMPPHGMMPPMQYQTMGRRGFPQSGPRPQVLGPGHMPEPRVMSNQWNDGASRQHSGGRLRGVTPATQSADDGMAQSNPVRQQQLQQQQPHQHQQQQQDQVRVFRAVFDYDPTTMSPNPDAASEELGLKEGELIKIIGDKDTDGFYFGELEGRTGYIPFNMISEVQDQNIVRDFLGASAADGTKTIDDRHGGVRRRMVALYDYNPTEASPNVDADAELSFRAGDFITVFGEPDDDGFYAGELRNRRGLVPSNFLRDAGGNANVPASSNRPPTSVQPQAAAARVNSGTSQNYQHPTTTSGGGGGVATSATAHSSNRSRTAERQRSSASLHRGGNGGSGGEGGGAASAGRATSSRSHQRGSSHDRAGNGNNNNNERDPRSNQYIQPQGGGGNVQQSSNTTHPKMLVESSAATTSGGAHHSRLTHQHSLSRNSSTQHLLHGSGGGSGAPMGSHMPNAS